ncbi:ABC transporter substrate-binding protein [Aliamphritea hakodatensis]|uniref:ABC transporter substrate-binding protein n=1 Tax=Aliamphritea hakodatensis TaxID=2895352 RepID=UPI0022FD5DAF|nr:ABC transporter substrate-binding protein [Aliamphritea hakodatensis]
MAINTIQKGLRLSRRTLLMAGTVIGLNMMVPFSMAAGSDEVLQSRSYVDITSLDPANYLNAVDEDVMGAIYSKLIYFKPGNTWEWELQAAESIEQVDATHIKFKLKEGIQFSNGFGEMTAEDVKFSFERAAFGENPAAAADWGGALEEVEVTGKYTGVIVLKKPYQPLWNLALSYAAGNIISQKAYESVGEFTNSPPASSGPYIVKEWRPKQKVILERNPDYYGEPSAYKEIHINQIDDEKTAEIAFESGNLDVTRISMSSVQSYRETPPDNSQLQVFPSLFYVWLGINFENPKLQDPRVRQAIQYAVDVPSILQASYFGEAEASTGIIAPGLLGHRAQSLIAPQADIAKAKALLEEAGVSNLELSLDVLNKATNVTTAQIIQALLSQIGIKVNINQHEAGSFWTLGSEKAGERWKNIELILNRYSMVPDPYYATVNFITSQKGKWNWERFSNEEFDQLNEQAQAELDLAKRGEMYQRMQDLMEESGSYRFITHEAEPLAIRNSVAAGLRPDGRPLYRHFKPAN